MTTMTNAIWLMIIGMIMLFIFFCLLYALLRFSTWLYLRLAPPGKPFAAADADAVKSAAPTVPDTVPAIIAAALHRYRRRR